MSIVRAAKAGDICVLLMPEKAELLGLRRVQETLAQAFDGWIVPEVHITCQRFNPEGIENIQGMLPDISARIAKLPSFPIYSDGLTQLLAQFWQTHVLRWKVQETAAWTQFVEGMDEALRESGLDLHYPHDRPFTCSALDLINPVQLEYAPQLMFPRFLFNARKVVFSRILGLNDFETLGTAELGQS
jgi:hypothetical protein